MFIDKLQPEFGFDVLMEELVHGILKFSSSMDVDGGIAMKIILMSIIHGNHPSEDEEPGLNG